MVAYSFKRRFVVPIARGLGVDYPIEFIEQIEDRPKRQTIRAGVVRRDGSAWSKPKGGRRHARPDEELQLYFGMRTKSCRLIGRARCTEVLPIIMWFDPTDLSAMIAGKILGPRQVTAFARADGFVDVLDMAAFWRKEHGRTLKKWEGVLIRWVPA